MSRPPSQMHGSRISSLGPQHSGFYAPSNMSGSHLAPVDYSGSHMAPQGSFVGSHHPPNASGYSIPPSHGMAPGMSSSALAISRPQSRIEPPSLAQTAGPMPGTLERPIHGPKKRLIMTCDGTWLNYDNGIVNGQKQPPSNVSRIGWAIKDTSRDGIPQIVNYQAGVGTNGGPVNKIVGGATGLGLKENVREAYTYIANNWREGDEIFLIGFSRGAFTARSVGGMIGQIGLLTRKGMPSFNEIYEDLEHKDDDRYQSKFPDSPFPRKGRFDRRYVAELQRLGMTRLPVDIKAVCCFDTVGSLGIPQTPGMSLLRTGRQLKAYQFFDTSLHPCIENAFQALALDEHRAAFSPALWEKRSDNDRTNLKQVWFPGVHSNIGGGYDDQEIANITLAWMISRLEPFLDFRPDFLITQHDENVHYYRDTDQKPRWWSFGEIYRSMRGIYAFGGAKVRTPGNYYRTDANTGRATTKRLRNTNEYIHASVRTRVGMQGPGIEDRGIYEPRALRDWAFETTPAPGPGQGGNLGDGGLIVWRNRGADRSGQDKIPEAVLLETELALLRQCPRVDEFVKNGAPSKRRSRRYENGGAIPPGANGTSGRTGGGDRRRSRRYESGGPDTRSLNGDIPPPSDVDDQRQRRKSGDPSRARDSSRRRRSRRYDDDDDGY